MSTHKKNGDGNNYLANHVRASLLYKYICTSFSFFTRYVNKLMQSSREKMVLSSIVSHACIHGKHHGSKYQIVRCGTIALTGNKSSQIHVMVFLPCRLSRISLKSRVDIYTLILLLYRTSKLYRKRGKCQTDLRHRCTCFVVRWYTWRLVVQGHIRLFCLFSKVWSASCVAHVYACAPSSQRHETSLAQLSE
jgi:hypothetical protein